MTSELKSQILNDIKDAMRARDKARLGTLRLLSSEMKQREVDNREDLDDPAVLQVLEKMLKQRRDSHSQFEAAGRVDLAAQEASEIEILSQYLPPALDEAELTGIIDAVIAKTGAESMRDMGKVMGLLKAEVSGRADMGAVSKIIKQRLS
jgi:uncharacterized protein YqeY